MKIECWKLAMYIWDEMSTADVRLQPNDCFKIGLCFHLWFERKSALWNCWINIAAIIHTHTHTMSNCNPGTNEGKRNDICLVYITSMTPFLFELYRNYGKRMDMCTECNAFKHTHTLLLSFYTLPYNLSHFFLRENRQDWPCTCFFVCIGTSSCLCECLQPSVCQLLLLISAGEVASVLSSDKALTLRVKECEPGAVTIKTFPWGGQCWTPQQTG